MTLHFAFTSPLEISLDWDETPLASLRPALLRQGKDLLTDAKIDHVEEGAGSAAVTLSLPDGVTLRLDLSAESDSPQHVSVKCALTNIGEIPLAFDTFAAPKMTLDPATFAASQPIWTMQGAATHWGQDFAFPLTPSAYALNKASSTDIQTDKQIETDFESEDDNAPFNPFASNMSVPVRLSALESADTSAPWQFQRENFLGHLQDGEGGGIPVNYFWKREFGIALMQIETQPKDWYMPVNANVESPSPSGTAKRAEGAGVGVRGKIETTLELRKNTNLMPGEKVDSLQVIVSAHHGDFFAPLSLYRELMAKQGLRAPQPVPADYEPAWCSWGYEFDVTPSEMTGVLPALQPLNIQWLTLDDRWFDAYGDWNPRADTFPGGADDMRRMNAEIHAAGGYSQVWWYPLCVEDGKRRWESHKYGTSQLLKDHPDWLVLNEDGSVARNNRHLAMLCPALPEVREHIRELTLRFVRDWGFDGHKLDNIYTMPACHNPAHHHTRPEESTEAFGEAYKIIFDITRELRPDSVTQICPCGTPLTLSLIPFTDQTVTADPTSSAQVRQRIKFYKALMGADAAVFADHVELSDGGIDFASGIGAGGVPSTKFIYPDDEEVKARLKEVWDFPPEKQQTWKKWFDLYNSLKLSQGQTLNLYDIAFDKPETYVIRKLDRLYYAFFSEKFSGKLTFRGLEEKSYQIFDYVNQKVLGTVNGSDATLDASFEGSLLVVAIPG